MVRPGEGLRFPRSRRRLARHLLPGSGPGRGRPRDPSRRGGGRLRDGASWKVGRSHRIRWVYGTIDRHRHGLSWPQAWIATYRSLGGRSEASGAKSCPRRAAETLYRFGRLRNASVLWSDCDIPELWHQNRNPNGVTAGPGAGPPLRARLRRRRQGFPSAVPHRCAASAGLFLPNKSNRPSRSHRQAPTINRTQAVRPQPASPARAISKASNPHDP